MLGYWFAGWYYNKNISRGSRSVKVVLFLTVFLLQYIICSFAFAEPPTTLEYQQMLSFFIGGLCGVAFAIATSVNRW